jgi:hypothetical protein
MEASGPPVMRDEKYYTFEERNCLSYLLVISDYFLL